MTTLFRAQQIAIELIAQHLNPQAWSFDFDRAKRRAGLCDFTRRRITVSRYFAEHCSENEIEQIVLHEIAHALAGHAAGHGKKWQQAAREIGYHGGRTTSNSLAEQHATWLGECDAGHTHYRFRQPTRPSSCGRCSRGFSRAHIIRWIPRAQSVDAHISKTRV